MGSDPQSYLQAMHENEHRQCVRVVKELVDFIEKRRVTKVESGGYGNAYEVERTSAGCGCSVLARDSVSHQGDCIVLKYRRWEP